jgi:hypothetical protein
VSKKNTIRLRRNTWNGPPPVRITIPSVAGWSRHVAHTNLIPPTYSPATSGTPPRFRLSGGVRPKTYNTHNTRPMAHCFDGDGDGNGDACGGDNRSSHSVTASQRHEHVHGHRVATNSLRVRGANMSEWRSESKSTNGMRPAVDSRIFGCIAVWWEPMKPRDAIYILKRKPSCEHRVSDPPSVTRHPECHSHPPR